MEFLTTLRLRLKALARRGQLERDLEDEMSFHLAMRASKLGGPVAARRAFGNPTAVRERCRDLWTFSWLESVAQDARYALRQLKRDPGFAAVAAFTLALGIGATTSIFTMFHSMLWKAYQLPQADSVVSVMQAEPEHPHLWNALTAGDFEDVRQSASSLQDLTGWQNTQVSLVDAGGEAIRVETSRVQSNFFDVLGVPPALGRGFQAGDDERAAVISDDLWRNHFAADPNIVGRTVRIDDRSCTIVGVAPPGFKFPRGWRDVWMPLVLTPEMRQGRALAMWETAGRLKPGRTLANLASEVSTIATRLEKDYPTTNRSRRFLALTMARAEFGDFLPIYETMLFGAALFVLLICCANVANLQFARATSRWREVAVRAAIGASRRRIMRQLITENALLAMAATILGLLAARWSLSVIKSSIPVEMRRYMPGWSSIGLNGKALAFALGAAALSGLLSGLAPAWRCSRTNLAESLKEAGRGSDGPARHRLRSLLVAGEIAMAVVLLAGAGLMVRGFRAIVAGPASLQPGSVLTFRVSLSRDKYPEDWQVARFYEAVLSQAATLPGVRSAAAVTALPYSRHATSRAFTIENRQPPPGPPPTEQVQAVSADYFRTLNIPLRAGSLPGENTAAISEKMAQRWWPNESPLGRRIRLGSRWVTIAGVVGNIPHSAVDREPRAIVYVPYQLFPERAMNVALRTATDPMALAAAASGVVHSIDRELPVENLATLEDLVHQEAFALRYFAWLMGAFGAVALALAGVGVYGVMSYLVSQQTHEIGIRLALGAPRTRVLRMIFRRGMGTAAFGIFAGVVPAYGMARLMAFAIWGVRAGDAVTMLGVPLGLAGVTALAILIPARRATRTDPMTALRQE